MDDLVKTKNVCGITKKQLHCIARHIQEYVKREMHGESDFPNACTNCPQWQSRINCHWDAFIALSEATGVNISPRKGFKV